MSDLAIGDPKTYRETFAEGLTPLLDTGAGLGAFILAFNNAAFDAELRRLLWPRLEQRFIELADELRRALRRGSDPAVPTDDLAVFLRMLAVGYQDLPPVDIRRADPWEVQFNLVRAFRPARSSLGRPASLRAAFDPAGFNFNRPFLRAETLWAGTLLGQRVDLLYNKFPFVPLQTILVPQREDELPQRLRHQDHVLAWSLASTLGQAWKAPVVGYNSQGAYASVNHLHFHLAMRAESMPIATNRWHHNGGGESYPLPCIAETDPETAWQRIADLQDQDQPFNLIYAPGRIYIIVRRCQGEYELPPEIGGHAWYELGGGLVCFDRERYQRLMSEEIARGIAIALPLSSL